MGFGAPLSSFPVGSVLAWISTGFNPEHTLAVAASANIAGLALLLLHTIWNTCALGFYERILYFLPPSHTMREPNHKAVYLQWPGKRKLRVSSMATPPR